MPFSATYSQSSFVKDSAFIAIQQMSYPEKEQALSDYFDQSDHKDLTIDKRIELLEDEIALLTKRDEFPLIIAEIHLWILHINETNNGYEKMSPRILLLKNFVKKHSDGSPEWKLIEGRIHSAMSFVYYWGLETQKGFDEELKALSYYEIAKDSMKIAKSLLALGIRKSEMGESEQSIEYYDQALTIFQNISNETYILRAQFCMVVDLIILKKYQEAKDILTEIVPVMQKNEHVNYGLARSKFGELEFYLGNYAAAENHFKLAMDHAKKRGSWNSLSIIAHKMSYFYKKQKRYEEALAYSEKEIIYNDSIYYQMVNSKALAASAKYEALGNQQKVKELEFQKELQQVQFRNNLIWVSALFLLLLSGIFFWFYRQSNHRKQNLLLAAKEHEVQKVRAKLLTAITHELRTPLTLVMGQLDNLSQQNLGKKANHQVEVAQRNSTDLLTQVNQLLEWNRIEAKATRLENATGDIAAMLKKTFENIRTAAVGKKISWKLSLSPEKLSCQLDFKKLETIIKNLLTNAIKFTSEGDTISLKMRLLNPTQLELIVEDNGAGIPRDQVDKIFEWYYQAQNQKMHNAQGFGIGLALSKELVNLMKGNIQLQSELGKFTRFTITIPFEKVATEFSYDAVQNDSNGKVADINSEKKNNASLLLIEDHFELSNHIVEILSSQFDINTADTAQRGLSLALEQLPEIIITDLMLPDQSGFDICNQLKSNILTEHIPIVILTARNDEAAKLQGLESRADAFLTKPFSAKELKLTLHNLLQNRRRLHMHYQRQLTSVAPEKSSPYIEKLINVIDDNFQDSHFNVDAFAKKLHISRAQLFNKTKSLLDISPSQMVKQYRLEKARQLLKTGDVLVSEAAYQCGFSSPEYFSTVYKEQFKISPNEEKKTSDIYQDDE